MIRTFLGFCISPFHEPCRRFVNRLSCRVNDCLLIAIARDAHECPLTETLEPFGSVPFLRLALGAMRKLRDFWSHYGEDVLLVFSTVMVFLGLYFVVRFLVTTF